MFVYFGKISKALRRSVALVIIFGISGCSPEKAEALLTSIKAFESKSLLALNQYELLLRESDDGIPTTMNDAFSETVGAIKDGNSDDVNLNSILPYFSTRTNNQSDSKIAREIAQIRVVYSSISESYESLPQGSILGASYVPCGLNVVARATGQLINFADILDQSPLYPNYLRQHVSEYKILVQDGNDPEARAKLAVIAQNIKIYDEKHNQTIRLTLAAVEEGRNVYELLESYNQVSVADILGVIQFGLDFLGSVQDVDVSQAVSRLESIETEFGNEDYWKRIKEIPIADLTSCPLEVEAESNSSE